MPNSADPVLSPSEQLLELEAIKQLKARYFRLMDTTQWLPFSLFWPIGMTMSAEFRGTSLLCRLANLAERAFEFAMPSSLRGTGLLVNGGRVVVRVWRRTR